MGLLKKHSAKSVNYFSAHLKDADFFMIFQAADNQ